MNEPTRSVQISVAPERCESTVLLTCQEDDPGTDFCSGFSGSPDSPGPTTGRLRRRRRLRIHRTRNRGLRVRPSPWRRSTVGDYGVWAHGQLMAGATAWRRPPHDACKNGNALETRNKPGAGWIRAGWVSLRNRTSAIDVETRYELSECSVSWSAQSRLALGRGVFCRAPRAAKQTYTASANENRISSCRRVRNGILGRYARPTRNRREHHSLVGSTRSSSSSRTPQRTRAVAGGPRSSDLRREFRCFVVARVDATPAHTFARSVFVGNGNATYTRATDDRTSDGRPDSGNWSPRYDRFNAVLVYVSGIQRRAAIVPPASLCPHARSGRTSLPITYCSRESGSACSPFDSFVPRSVDGIFGKRVSVWCAN